MKQTMNMKKAIQLRLLTVIMMASVAIGAMAQTPVKINKVARMQKANGKSVLRSTDSRLPQTLVYFDHEVDAANLPQEVLDFFGSYEEALRRIEAGEAPENVLSLSPNAASDSVGPVLGDIEFDQGDPYNRKCPYLNNGRAITGCVATAMAQIMTYYQYPAVGTGTVTYTGTGGAQTYNFADHPFNWSNILHTYKNGSFTSAQADAVAELMLACGASVNMNYNTNESGAHSQKVLPALRDYFGYDASIGWVHDATDEIIATAWVARLKMEANAKRPVYYAGSTQTSGHAFVIDGYKIEGETTYFHVNWGWNGAHNGWFLITRLKPQSENYSLYSNDMVYNIFPPGMGIKDVTADGPFRLNMSEPVYTILGTKIPATDMQRGFIYIQNGHKFVY